MSQTERKTLRQFYLDAEEPLRRAADLSASLVMALCGEDRSALEEEEANRALLTLAVEVQRAARDANDLFHETKLD